MDLSTTYLGFNLPHPFLAGASPVADNLDTVRQAEDAGMAAIVLRSLFEEQIIAEGMATLHSLDDHADSFAEARSYLPNPDAFVLGPGEYLEHLRQVKAAVEVPVIASLNGTTPLGWLKYGGLVEEAGADALELNLYDVPTDLTETAEDIERRTIEVVSTLTEKIKIPVSVKLSPFYTAPANFASHLQTAGAAGFVLFNRFFEPDIDIEDLEVSPRLTLSDSSELLLRLRWLAILSERVEASLAVSGGVHTEIDAVKAVMCGAHAVQLVSTLLRHGPQRLAEIRQGISDWLEEHEYDSLAQMQGSMNLQRCPDPTHYGRVNYMQLLQTWEPV